MFKPVKISFFYFVFIFLTITSLLFTGCSSSETNSSPNPTTDNQNDNSGNQDNDDSTDSGSGDEANENDNDDQTGELNFTSDTPLAPGAVWHFYGDSQTAGRADEESAVSHAVAFENIWIANNNDPTSRIDGVGGCSILNSMERYQARGDKGTVTFIHFQESGNQNRDGQRTPEEFAASFESFVREIVAESPNTVITTETAYSFQRDDISYRNWDAHNTALKNKALELEDEGITIYIAEVDTYMKELVENLGFSNVITDDGGHYRGVGNLLVALSIYKSIGYDVESLDLSNISISADHKQLCIDITM